MRRPSLVIVRPDTPPGKPRTLTRSVCTARGWVVSSGVLHCGHCRPAPYEQAPTAAALTNRLRRSAVASARPAGSPARRPRPRPSRRARRAQAAALLTAAVLSSGALFAYHCAREQLALAALHPVALYTGLAALLVLPVNLLFRVRGAANNCCGMACDGRAPRSCSAA
jgi:hypothetical protein